MNRKCLSRKSSTKLFIGLVVAWIIVCVLNSPYVHGCEFLDKLSPYQKEIASMSYKEGVPYHLGRTAVAVAWKESKLGLYKIRYGKSEYDRSFGIGHTAIYWKTKTMSSFEKGRWAQKMVEDDEYSINVMISDILYWQNRDKTSWQNAVAMYNGGSTLSDASKNYASDVANIIGKLNNCVLR